MAVSSVFKYFSSFPANLRGFPQKFSQIHPRFSIVAVQNLLCFFTLLNFCPVFSPKSNN